MKTSMKKLFSLIAASFSLVASVSAQKFDYSGYYSPSNTPWQNNYPMHSASNGWGHAQGGGELALLEARHGGYVMDGDNAYGAGYMAEANLVRGTISGTAGTHSIMDGDRVLVFNEANGSAEWKIGARGYAESGIYWGDDPSLKAHAGVQAGQSINVDGDVRTRLAGLGFGAQGEAEAGVGVEAGAGMKSGVDGTEIGAGAFAGDYVRAEGSADIGGIGLGGEVQGWAGVGAEIKAEASFEDGVLEFKPTLGLALGGGGKVAPKIKIDLNKVEEEMTEFGDNVGHYGGQAIEAIETEVPKAFEELGQGTVDAANTVAQEMTNVGNTIADGSVQTWNTVEQGTMDAANTVGQGFVDAGNTVAQEMTNVGNTIADGSVQTWNTVEQGTVDAANTVGQGFVDAGNTVAQEMTHVGNTIADGTVQTWNTVEQGTVDVANQVGQGFVDAGNTIGQGTVDAANTVGQGVVDAGNAVGGWFKSWF